MNPIHVILCRWGYFALLQPFPTIPEEEFHIVLQCLFPRQFPRMMQCGKLLRAMFIQFLLQRRVRPKKGHSELREQWARDFALDEIGNEMDRLGCTVGFRRAMFEGCREGGDVLFLLLSRLICGHSCSFCLRGCCCRIFGRESQPFFRGLVLTDGAELERQLRQKLCPRLLLLIILFLCLVFLLGLLLIGPVFFFFLLAFLLRHCRCKNRSQRKFLHDVYERHLGLAPVSSLVESFEWTSTLEQELVHIVTG
mmetsp:Transcript_35038/g.104502  ORF Transcript_35038/g.104502 Transcript_35038/m.104502 type:complete len:252 (+) Transcript_35038:1475-2230(+)